MNAPARKLSCTYAEYLEQERASPTKHEFLGGESFAMAGGTPEHARLSARVIVALGAQLTRRPCDVFSSDLRVRVLATGLATYPDVSVVCGQLARDPEDKDAVVNPLVLVEVLSDSSEAYDRGEKFAHYRRIPSLKEYVLVSQAHRRIEVFRRNEDSSWTLHEAGPGERARLASIDGVLDVDEIYGGVLETPAAG
ncbi:Uma2 family endonuclease [Sorangium sp. So ce1078]|uniref:Uma2 family endonuclease n=1 Tax=Sorangium sp. So ce1078 TaxID=3133329 RepID=UPI003F612DB3